MNTINNNEKDFLNFYMEQTWEEMRHIENLRERVTILVVTVASAIVGFVMQQKFAIETKPFVWFVILLGVFGLLMTLKLFQLHKMSQKRLDKWYKYYEGFCGDNPQILELRKQADKENKEEFSFIAPMRHNYFWSAIHIFIITAGIVLFTMFPSKQCCSKTESHCSKMTEVDTTINVNDTSKLKTK